MAVDGKTDASGHARVRELLAQVLDERPRFAPGAVWLVGAGPGDPGLLTLDALAALAQADIVVHDALVDERVLKLVRPETEKRFVGKRGGRPSTSQAAITDLLISAAAKGQRVLRLKGGDPFVFGRGGEEMLALAKAGIPHRVVPGMTSGLAALAAAAIPATLRGVNQAIVLTTGHAPTEADTRAWVEFARLGAPLVFYMAIRSLSSIVEAVIAGGLSPTTPAAIIASATLTHQQVVVSTVKELVEASDGIEGPAIVVIGEIVRVRTQLIALASAVHESNRHCAPALETSCGT
jgi:uroporphyrin-III C-methyltransferase